MNIEEGNDMLLLADHVESGDRKGCLFSMAFWFDDTAGPNHCGMACCMGGEAVHLFPDKMGSKMDCSPRHKESGAYGIHAMEKLFGLNEKESRALFGSTVSSRLYYGSLALLPKSIIAKTNQRRECARSLRRYVKWNRKQKGNKS